ncbi:MAG: TonB-dependent receptor [bacterium]|nr:TonB-dependent receptor [bacterium]
MRKVFLTLLTLTFLFTSLTVFAGTTGALLGFITEEDGSPVGEATIMVVERDVSVVSNEYGMFSIPSVAPGLYTVEVKKAGYGPVNIEKVIIQVDLTTPLNVTLKKSEVELDPIVVTASRILVHREQTGTVYRVDHDDVVEMSSRDIFRVAQAMPGVISNEDGQFKIRGSRYDQTLFMIDGLTIMDPFWKTFGATPNAKGIMGEVAVITGGFDAEYGDAIGGVVNTVSRNPNYKEHRGSFTYYTSQVPNYHDMWTESIKLGEKEWDLDMDGPLTPDLGYVFAAQVFKANASTTSGYQNENYEEFHDYHFKLSYNLSPTTNLSYHYNYGFAWIRLQAAYENSGFPGWPIQFQFNRMHHAILDTYIGDYTTATLALGWFQSGIDFGPHAEDEDGNVLWNEIKPLFEYDGDDYYAKQRTRSVAQEVKLDVETKMFDRHTLKSGVSLQHTFVDMFWTVCYDTYFFGSNATWPEFAYYEDWEHSYDYTAAYVQDKYDLIKDKLTLTAGVRYEEWGFIPQDNSVVAPRGGVSYQLNDYTIVRTNYSKMYQSPNVASVYEHDIGGLQNYFGDQDWGNTEDIVPQVTDIIEVGFQRQLGNDYIFEVNAYDKQMDKIHCVWENPVTKLLEYNNGGSGWAHGVEFTLRKSLSNNFKGWVNYSWMEAKGTNIARDFTDYDNIGTDVWDKEYYLDWDQTHNINVNLFYQTENFFMNLIWRWGSGYPYTPHDSFEDFGLDGLDSTVAPFPPADYGEGNGVYDEGETTYASNNGEVYNSERYPAYNRVDVVMKLKLKNLNLFGAEYWFNVTARNIFDHHNLRQRGGNDPSDIDPYTGEPWINKPTGGTKRRIVAGIEANW